MLLSPFLPKSGLGGGKSHLLDGAIVLFSIVALAALITALAIFCSR